VANLTNLHFWTLQNSLKLRSFASTKCGASANSASLSNTSHPSSEHAFKWFLSDLSSLRLFDDMLDLELMNEDARLPSLSRFEDEPFSASRWDAVSVKGEQKRAKSLAALFRDEPDEARMQLVWLEERDLLNGTSKSNFSFRCLTSWTITEISPLKAYHVVFRFLIPRYKLRNRKAVPVILRTKCQYKYYTDKDANNSSENWKIAFG